MERCSAELNRTHSDRGSSIFCPSVIRQKTTLLSFDDRRARFVFLDLAQSLVISASVHRIPAFATAAVLNISHMGDFLRSTVLSWLLRILPSADSSSTSPPLIGGADSPRSSEPGQVLQHFELPRLLIGPRTVSREGVGAAALAVSEEGSDASIPPATGGLADVVCHHSAMKLVIVAPCCGALVGCRLCHDQMGHGCGK